MRKALGLLAWTSLAASGLWATLPGGTTRPVSADQPVSTGKIHRAVRRQQVVPRARDSDRGEAKRQAKHDHGRCYEDFSGGFPE